MNELAAKLIEANKQSKAPFLDLGNCGLPELPGVLADMKWLERLNLGGLYFDEKKRTYIRSANEGENNKFTEGDLLVLEDLPGLKSLSLSGAEVRDFSFLTRLPALESLDASYTGIDTNVLRSLTRLKWLNLRQSRVNTKTFSFLKGLQNLEYLDLSYTKAPGYDLLEKLPRLKFLFLHSCEAREIGFLRKLPQLEFIDLHRNQITDYTPIEALTHLTGLDISENRIGDYSFLNRSVNLRSLNISENRISDYSFLFNLRNLQSLNLNQNGENEYRFLAELKNLGSLSLSFNKISNIDFLKGLDKLETLELRDNLITNIDALQPLIMLQSLDLDFNQLTGIDVLGGLKALQTLSLNSNKISDIQPLAKLKNLRSLNLDFNQLADIEALGELKELQTLSLNSNKISNIQPLEKLNKKLQSLALGANQLRDVRDLLPLQALLVKKDFVLTIADNPFLKNTELVLDRHKNHTESILNLLRRHIESDKHDVVLPAKVLLLGNHASGKSSLLHYIKNERITGTTSSTHIIRIEKYPLRESFPSAIFFDFGGQDYYHGIYRAFLSMGALQVIVWNSGTNKNAVRPTDANGIATRDYNIGYWLGQRRYMEMKFGGTPSPVLLVQSHADKDPKLYHAFENNSVTNEYCLSLNALGEQTQESAARKKEFESARKHFLASLLYMVEASQKKRQEPQWYINFLKYILEERKGDKLFEPVPVAELKKTYKIPENYSFEEDLNQLHRKGLVLYYRDLLPSCVWLNPEELVRHVHDTLLSKEKLLSWKGRLPAKELTGYNDHIIRLLENQKVLFKHATPDAEEYIIPNYLPLAQNDKDYGLFSFGVQTVIFVLRFEQFIPFGLINQMICFYGALPGVNKFWRDQVLFAFNAKLILIRVDFDALEIRVQGTADTTEGEKQFLFYSILSLYWDLQPLSFEDFRTSRSPRAPDNLTTSAKETSKPEQFDMISRVFGEEHYFPRDLYISVNDKDYIRYFDLYGPDVMATKITAYPLAGQTLNKLRGKEVALHPFQPFTLKPLRKTKNVFISYSHDDKAYREEAQKFLVNLEREKLIEIWQDGLISPGDEWDEKINDSLQNADIIILLVSQAFINSAYIHETEMSKAVKKAEEKTALIVPFLLKNCDWEKWKVVPEGMTKDSIKDNKGLMGKYQFLPLDDGEQRLDPIVKWANAEDAWMKLVNAIRKIV